MLCIYNFWYMPIKSFLIFLCFIISSSNALSKTVADTLEVTRKNIEGHKNLYNEGWMLVTSTKEAIEAARKNSTSSAQALRQALVDLSARQPEFKDKIYKILEQSVSDSKKIKSAGTEVSQSLKEAGSSGGQASWRFSQKKYAEAYSAVTLGYLEYGKRNSQDWEQLKKINSDFTKRTLNIKNDHEIKIIMESFYDEAAKKSDEGLWAKSISKAQTEFNESYEESGKESNSLTALPSIVAGYIKSLYYGLASPTGQTVGQGLRKAGSSLTGMVLRTTKITGDLVVTTGLNVFYGSKMGYRLISPSIEGGYLASLALISSATSPIVYGIGHGLGTLNQVAVTTAAPVVGTGEFVIAGTLATAKHTALMTYDLTKGVGATAANTGKTFVVLGYNALTALPTQTLLAAGNAAIFLVYDGPRLAIVALKGEIDGVPINQVPVGTVLDANKLKNQNIQIETINSDKETLEKVLNAAPTDLMK